MAPHVKRAVDHGADPGTERSFEEKMFMIVIENSAQGQSLQPVDFDLEKQLEDVICRYPQLLSRDDDAALSLIGRQIRISSAPMDVMMIDSDGLPVAVEVKLGRNAQARREILGQLVDYVSVLTEYTVDELDDLVSRNLWAAIETMTPDEAERKKVWQAVGSNLRAGLVRYILVLDEVPPELVRIVRFLALRSNLDIRLVKISKYVASSGQVVYVPQNFVEQSESGTDNIVTGGSKASERLQEVIDAYALTPRRYPLRGQAMHYRQISPQAWPKGVHYEFVYRAKSIQVDIHLENAKVRRLAPLLKGWETTPPPGFPHALAWDSKASGQDRLNVILPPNSTPAEIVQAMVDLIAVTESDISAAL